MNCNQRFPVSVRLFVWCGLAFGGVAFTETADAQSPAPAAPVKRTKLAATTNVQEHGAKGDGVTDDRAAIQKAIDSADVIFFPQPTSYYKVVGSLKAGGSDGRGQKRFVGEAVTRDMVGKGAVIRGDGSAPLFMTGKYPGVDGTTNRGISFERLSITTEKHPVIQFHNAVNFMVENCHITSTKCTDAAISVRYSYRGTIRDSSVACSGGGFVVTAYDNCNGLRIRDCVLSGGRAGGVLHLEQSQGVSFTGNVIEVSKFGIAICTFARPDKPDDPSVEGAGNVNGFDCSGNYIETVEAPFLLGTKGTVMGASIEGNYCGTTSVAMKEYGFTEQPVFRIGRLNGSSIRANSILQPKESTLPIIEAIATQGAQFPVMQSTSIESNIAPFGTGPFFANEKSIDSAIKSRNKVQADRGISAPIISR